ncbi:hypothetical protein DFQ27_007249 [Actinomortierella ambigua]|uniref:Carboxypeptidase M14A n=1 Tax=Actinomortierella ambigua TaxID=1343610 RepID=A0A9P6PVG1_9FUNG|nr:hypothetical protein DFQ27_007249 [Actinomortierella ambigua]
MRFSLISLAAVAALATQAYALPAAPSQALFRNDRVVRIEVKDEATLKALSDNEEALNFDYFTHNKNIGGNIDIHVSADKFAQFEALKIPYTVLIPDLQAVIDAEQKDIQETGTRIQQELQVQRKKFNAAGEDLSTYAAPVWFQNYHTYAEHTAWINTQISQNPGKASAISFGNSSQGRPQAGIKIGNGPNHVVFHGTQHSREWITTMVVEYIADQLLTGSDPRVAGYLSKFTFHVVPIMNPDGFVITQTSNRMHRKNGQTNGGCVGTDTNRNWGYQWNTGGTSNNPCSDTYRGPKAFSSPEATNVANYLKALVPNVAMYIDVHSYSQLWMTPWGYTGTRPSNYNYLLGLANTAANAIKAVHGMSFRTGDIYNTIYPASGNSADFAQSIGVKVPFAVELRDKGQYGFNLPANQIIPSGEETWAGFAAVLDKL